MKQTSLSVNRDLFLFIGPPGSGKGTLADACVKTLGWKQLSTGNLCRQHIAEQTDIGKQIDFAIKSGKLVADSLIVAMVHDWFSRYLAVHHTVILDGFPRTVPQAQELSTLLEKNFDGARLQIIQLEISDEGVIQRLCSRYVCENKECQAVYSLASGSTLAPKVSMICDICTTRLIRRKDDEEATVRERLAGYYKHEKALLDFYAQGNTKVHQLSVEKPMAEVFKDFRQLVGLEQK